MQTPCLRRHHDQARLRAKACRPRACGVIFQARLRAYACRPRACGVIIQARLRALKACRPRACTTSARARVLPRSTSNSWLLRQGTVSSQTPVPARTAARPQDDSVRVMVTSNLLKPTTRATGSKIGVRCKASFEQLRSAPANSTNQLGPTSRATGSNI